MPKLLYAPACPYFAKVRMAADLGGIALETEIVDTSSNPPVLINANPLGKIPTLITEDGISVYDSRVITQYLNRLSGNKIFPRNAAKRLESETLEALADGICDSLLSMVYERRTRPEDKVHEPWLDRQWTKATRGLDLLNANPPKLPKNISVGQIAVRALIGYLDLRFAGKWEKGRGKLKRWAVRFDEKWPSLAEKTPK